MCLAEAMHVVGPLQADDGPFDRPEQGEGHDDGQRRPDGQMLPGRERAGGLDAHEGADDDVADDDHHQIGGQVVGAVVVHVLAAGVAGRDDREEAR